MDRLIAHGEEVQALTTRKTNNDSNLISISSPIEIPKKLLTLGNGTIDYFLSKKIKQQITTVNPDVIHIQDTYILPATVKANKLLKVPTVATIRNNVLDQAWEMMFPKPVSTLLKRRNKVIVSALREVKCVIAVSQYIKMELVQRGIDDSKIFPIYNLPPSFSISECASNNKDSTIRLFAPGLLASFKGFSVLVKAMKRVTEIHPNVHLMIAGDGPQRGSLERMVAKLELASNVDFAGKVPFASLSQFYGNCDIVIFPSIFPEPFGRVALEAMFFGKPVIASKVGGIPEVVTDGVTGLLVPPNDDKALAKCINALVDDRSQRLTMGNNAIAKIEKMFSTEEIIKQHLEVYKKAT